MAKQRLLDSWLNNTKSNKPQKPLIEANKLELPQPNPQKIDSKCCICETSGALITCFKCSKVFHLSCLDLQPLDLPLSQWPCSHCKDEQSSQYLKELEQFAVNQRENKEKGAKKKAKNEIQAFLDPKIQKFQKKFPNLVKKGEIQYPIDDTLLWKQTSLHQILKIDFPVIHFPSIPTDIYPDLIAICDFSHKFRGFLNTPTLNCDSLYQSLNQAENPLIKTLLIRLLKPFSLNILKSEGFRKESPLNFFIYKTKKLVSTEYYLDFYYLQFLSQVFKLDLWEDLIEDYCKHHRVPLKTLDFSRFHSFDLGLKVKVLDVIVELLLESQEINEECVQRQESQLQLKKELSEFVSQMKNTDSQETAEKIEKIQKRLASVSVRTNKLGWDRNWNEYFFFQWDKSVYVKLSGLDQDSPSWGVYSNRTEVKGFLRTLCYKGVRESELIEKIEDLLSRDLILNEDNEGLTGNSEGDSGAFEGSSSELSEDLNKVYALEDLREWVHRLYEYLEDNLDLTHCGGFLENLQNSGFSKISNLLGNFQENLPTKKWKKELEGLWDGSEFFSIWEKAVQGCKEHWELMGCIHLLERQIKEFCKRNQRLEEEEEENNYESIRKEYRVARMKRLRKLQKAEI